MSDVTVALLKMRFHGYGETICSRFAFYGFDSWRHPRYIPEPHQDSCKTCLPRRTPHWSTHISLPPANIHNSKNRSVSIKDYLMFGSTLSSYEPSSQV